MGVDVRMADRSDLERIREVGARAGSRDVDDSYLTFVAAEGRLVVAIADGTLVGYAGAVPVGAVTMISDLFVDPSAQRRGTGAMLAAAVVAGSRAVQTCSSQHPAASSVYSRLGLEVRDRLLYVRGTCVGGGDPLAATRWRHGRASLARYFESIGAVVSADAVVCEHDDAVEVLRLQAPYPVEAVRLLLKAFPAGRPVRACVPESSSVARWMLEHGFDVTDHDIVMAQPNVVLDTVPSLVHPGLW
jgi:GNAT superfamily N-acetyltransferase